SRYCSRRFSAHVLHPGAGRMGIHVDYPYWAMPAPFPAQPILEIQAIWLLEDFTPDNGAPYFVPESQKWCCPPEPEKFAAHAEQITGPAGSVLLSHGLAWHDTSENRSRQPRVSLLGNYTPKFVQPLEDNCYGFEPAAAEKFSPRLQQLLRFNRKPSREPVYPLWERL
ncbi:MAG: phytanoyl-CoA dioxygenase, partial [Spirulinaceae cyanobacterium RM2_2_10]|nr:phytanoyl-CoA dioxygenase [Spirulinaceae cyanobacterium RM2_2_10]